MVILVHREILVFHFLEKTTNELGENFPQWHPTIWDHGAGEARETKGVEPNL